MGIFEQYKVNDVSKWSIVNDYGNREQAIAEINKSKL